MTYILQCCFVVAFAGLAAEIAAHQLNTRDSNSGGGCKRILGGEAQAVLTLQTWQAFDLALHLVLQQHAVNHESEQI